MPTFFDIQPSQNNYETLSSHLRMMNWLDYILLDYCRRALKSRGSYGNLALFLLRSQYISLDFYVLRKTQNGKCSS